MVEPPTFPVTVTLPVQWGEMDAFGHVNNTATFRWFETARIAYFGAMGLPGWSSAAGTGPILHSTSARYRLPIVFPDTVTVGARVDLDGGAIGDDRFTMQYALWSHQRGAVASEGTGIVVVFDYAAGKKARVDDAIRGAIERVERGPRRALG